MGSCGRSHERSGGKYQREIRWRAGYLPEFLLQHINTRKTLQTQYGQMTSRWQRRCTTEIQEGGGRGVEDEGAGGGGVEEGGVEEEPAGWVLAETRGGRGGVML